MVAWFLIAVVHGAQTPVTLELPEQAPCALSTALPLALGQEQLVVSTSPLRLSVVVREGVVAVSLAVHGVTRATRELGFRGEDCPVLPQVIATLARAWVDRALKSQDFPSPVRRAKVEPASEPEPVANAPPESRREPEPASDATPPIPRSAVSAPPPVEEPTTPPLPVPEHPSAPEANAEPAPKRPVLAFEAGVDVFGRAFSYSLVAPSNLRSYTSSFVLAPEFRAELYPLALWTKGALSGLGIDGSFATALGLKSRRSGTDTTWPTTLTHFEVDVRFRVRPVSTLDAAVIPFAGFGNRQFQVGTGNDGTALDGVAAVSYSSLRFGVAGELPLLTSGISVFAKLAALVVLSSGQIISPDFFPHGSNFGVEGQLGVGYRVVGPLELRLAFDYTHYGMTFQSTTGDTYVASGAADIYLGGNFAVRLIL